MIVIDLARLEGVVYIEVSTIEILDLECMLCHVIGVQNENKNALS